MHYALDVVKKRITILEHGTINVAFGVNTVVSPELAHPVVVEVTILGGYVDVRASGELPDEMVSGLLDVAWHTDVLGALLLRVELGLAPGLA